REHPDGGVPLAPLPRVRGAPRGGVSFGSTSHEPGAEIEAEDGGARVNRVGWVGAVLLLGAWDPTTSKNGDVEKGDSPYKAGEYDAAQKNYEDALKKLPSEPGVHFDLGTTYYQRAQAAKGPEREEMLKSAEKEFELAGDATDPKLRGAAHYDLGNTYYSGQH